MVAPAGSAATNRRLVRLLTDGAVAIVPCDTIYGIVGVVPQTVERIKAIKGRGEARPFLQLVADPSWVRRICGVDAPPRLARLWPGPLTLVLPRASGGTVALRVPGAVWMRELIAAVGRPLYSTSVNRSGNPPLWRIKEIVKEFEAEVDLVVDGGDLRDAVASTVVDATARPYRVLREGAIALGPDQLDPGHGEPP